MSFDIKTLCPPALLYFLLSIATLILIIFQNLGNKNNYTFGSFSCVVPNTFIILIVELIYILFWTWVLNLICKDGYTGISWLLVLFPILLFFVINGLAMINKKH
jgi:hypothetical protein